MTRTIRLFIFFDGLLFLAAASGDKIVELNSFVVNTEANGKTSGAA